MEYEKYLFAILCLALGLMSVVLVACIYYRRVVKKQYFASILEVALLAVAFIYILMGANTLLSAHQYLPN